jgi:hypothetical protein
MVFGSPELKRAEVALPAHLYCPGGNHAKLVSPSELHRSSCGPVENGAWPPRTIRGQVVQRESELLGSWFGLSAS